MAPPLAVTTIVYVPASAYTYEAVSPILALTASAPSTPGFTSNVVAKSALATTSICFEIVSLLVIATTKF